MRRRRLLMVGSGAGLALMAAGGAAAWLVGRHARRAGRFEPDTRLLLLPVGATVLAGLLPQDTPAKSLALHDWLVRLETTVSGMPAAVQQELDELLLMLLSAPGRLALAGLRPPWHTASLQEVQAALRGMQMSTWGVRQQIFHALRDLSNAAYFAAPASWAALGYPGPPKV